MVIELFSLYNVIRNHIFQVKYYGDDYVDLICESNLFTIPFQFILFQVYYYDDDYVDLICESNLFTIVGYY